MIYAQDVRPLFRWFTKNKFRWFLMCLPLFPVHVIAYMIIGINDGVKVWLKGFNLKDAGYWHEDK